jgi:hypothetical protein
MIGMIACQPCTVRRGISALIPGHTIAAFEAGVNAAVTHSKSICSDSLPILRESTISHYGADDEEPIFDTGTCNRNRRLVFGRHGLQRERPIHEQCFR